MELPETDSEDELAPGWEERCTLDGQVFYAHHGTQTTQWRHPRTGKKKAVSGALPIGWRQEVDAEGNVNFVHDQSNRSTYTDPRLAFAVEETEGIHDLRQRFDASSTGLQVLHGRDLSGYVAVVTGANSGIGFETARCFAFQGCTVVMACRDTHKAQAAIKKILKQRPFAVCHLFPLDLSSLRSVQSLAKKLLSQFSVINYLVLNAGIFNAPHCFTVDGLEQTYQVNHLAHFYLAELLSPALKPSARVVWLSAESHRFPSIAGPEEITEECLSPPPNQHSPILAYNNSKLCNLLMAFEFQRRNGHRGINSYAVHPGNVICSAITRNSWLYWMFFNLLRPWSKTMQQACASTIYSACSPDLEQCGGVYINGCLPCSPSLLSLDPIAGQRLHALNTRLIERALGTDAFTSTMENI